MENTHVGPFHIHNRLGVNRRQKVYRATQTEQNIDVALKFIGMPKDAERLRAIEKIQIEIELLKKLRHPNLVQLLGAGVEDDQIFFASELIKCESLTALLSRRGKFAADQVVDYGGQIAQLLDYLHDQDILHSKLTPDKILVTREGVVKVADLRLNRSRKRRWDSSRKRELDIAAYMAPEQFTQGATAKSDIYSLGVMMYEMLSGKLPYEPDTLGRMARKKMRDTAPSVASQVMNCPVWLDKLVCQMISPDPRRRPHTAKAVILALDEIRKIDKTKKAAVSQVSGAFNPLTAGTDKTEANRLLGKKRVSAEPSSFFQSFGFLAVGLAFVLTILLVAMWPASSQKNLERAEKMMASEKAADWREARDYLKPIIARGATDPLFAQAEELYFESRRRTLVLQAERGRVLGLQSREAQRFVEAVKLQGSGELEAAQKIFVELTETVAADGEQRHIGIESLARSEAIADELVTLAIAELEQTVEFHRGAQTPESIEAARQFLDQVVVEHSGDQRYAHAVSKAREVLGELPLPDRMPDEKTDLAEPPQAERPEAPNGGTL